MNVPLMYSFRSLSNKFPTIFGSLIFTFHFLVRLFFAEKRKPKIFGLKNAMEREIRGHEGEGNNCFSKIQLVGQKYRD